MIRPFAAPEGALLRGIPDSYPLCLRENTLPIDVALARVQHAAYAAALEDAGIAVATLAAEASCPDCVFIEDIAAILGARAVLTRPGASARRPECLAVAEALAGELELHSMAAPATLDGGDVLRVGDTLYVGLSGRTNAAGFVFLAGVAAAEGIHAVPVPLAAGLHLKSASSLVSPELVVLEVGPLDPALFRAAGVEVLVIDEAHAGNVLALGSRVLVSAAAPKLADLLTRRGLDVVALDLSELHKGDGALTCLSLRIPAPGTWCA